MFDIIIVSYFFNDYSDFPSALGIGTNLCL